MIARRLALACVVGALAALALPALAAAKTKTVDMGIPPAFGERFERLGLPADVNAFFPRSVTINRGDTVRFRASGFHTFDLPPRGGDRLPLLSAAGEVAGANDAAGVPFWFNGENQYGFNPRLGPPGNFGKLVRYNGSRRQISGLPLANRPKPVRVRFTRNGRFTYLCNLHPGMKGTVNVRPRGRSVPSRRADTRAVRAQVTRSLRTIRRLPDATPPDGTVNAGVAGRGGEELFAFVPNAVTVNVGDRLRFRVSPGSYDAHTATAGPGNPEDEPDSYLGQLAGTFQGPGPFDARSTYRSEAPQTTATLTPTLHGNGFWNSGLLDRAVGAPLGRPFPTNDSVVFGATGAYDFWCLIHPFMRATVTVQP